MLWFFKATFRKPHLVAAALFSVLLATTFIVSTFLGVDLSVYLTIEEALKGVPYDVRVFIDTPQPLSQEQIQELVNRVLDVDYVTSVKVLYRILWSPGDIILSMKTGSLNATLNANRSLCLVGLFDNSPVDAFSGGVPAGSISLDEELMALTGLEEGEKGNITVRYYNYTEYAEATFKEFVVARPFVLKDEAIISTMSVIPDIRGKYDTEDVKEFYRYVVMNSTDFYDFTSFLQSNVTFAPTPTLVLLINVDRLAVIDPWDFTGTLTRLQTLQERIYFAITGYLETIFTPERTTYPAIYNDIYSVYVLRALQLSFQRGIFTLMSLPVLVMGGFLAYLVGWLFVNERRKDIGLMKIRGVSESKIKWMLALEFAIVGAVAGLLSSVLSVLLAPYLAYNVFQIEIPWDALIAFVQNTWKYYAIAATIVGFILAFFAARSPAKAAAEMDASRALYEYIEEIEKPKINVRRNLIFVGIGAYGLAELILGSPVMVTVSRVVSEVASRVFIIVFVFIIFAIFEIFATFIGPFLFAYSTLKLITHYSVRTGPYLSRIVKPFAGDLSDVIVKNFLRKPRRISIVGFLIVLMIGTALAFSITSYTTLMHNRIRTEYEVGADVKIPDIWVQPENFSRFAEQLSAIEGIARFARVRVDWVSSEVGTWIIVWTDPSYLDVVGATDRYFEDINLQNAKEVLSSKDYCLLSVYAKRELGYSVGSKFERAIEGEIVSLTVKGFVKFLPGLFPVETPQQSPIALMNFNQSGKASRYAFTLLVDVKEGYNATEVAESIRSLVREFGGLSGEPIVLQERLKEVEEMATSAAVYRFSNFMFVYSSIIALFGIALTMVMAAIERRKEIALLRVRGLSTGQILLMFLVEGLLIVILSVSLGLLIALGYASLVLPQKPTSALAGYYIEYPPEFTLYIPTASLLSLGLFVGLLLLVSLVPAYIVSRENIVENLRVYR